MAAHLPRPPGTEDFDVMTTRAQIWNEAIRAAAKAAEAPDRAGREWVFDSVWDHIKKDTARDILKLLIDEGNGDQAESE